MKDRIGSPCWVPLVQALQRRLTVRGNVVLEQRVHLGLGTVLWAPNRLVVRHDVYVGRSCVFECDGEIGSGTLIGNRVALLGRHDHDAGAVGVPVVSAPWIGNADYSGPGRGLEVVIGPDVWVGYGSIVLTGVRVGRGAVIAAGSVVVGDVEPYDIVAGNPARVVGERLDPADRPRHERTLQERWGVPYSTSQP